MLQMRFKSILLRVKFIVFSHYYKMKNKSSHFAENVVLFNRAHIANTTVGKYTYFAGHARVNNAVIGSFCSIADGVKIGLGMHPIHHISTHPIFYSSETIFPYKILSQEYLDKLGDTSESLTTRIGNDVWIGTNAIIMDGVVVGDGAVIGAGAVVTKDVEPYAIAVGVPARTIKYRPIPEKIDGIDWWDLSISSLTKYLEGK